MSRSLKVRKTIKIWLDYLDQRSVPKQVEFKWQDDLFRQRSFFLFSCSRALVLYMPLQAFLFALIPDAGSLLGIALIRAAVR